MQSTLQRVMDSILAVDVGSVWTHALLFDRVGGRYRFVARGAAPTTIEPPHADVVLGARAAIHRIEEGTGRRFLDESGDLITPEQANGSGCDLFLCTSSAGPPLRVATGGLVGRVSGASARRAAWSTYSELIHHFALDDPQGRWGSPRGAVGVVEALLHEWPEAVLLAGGTEGGAERNLLELAGAIALALQAAPDRLPPTLLFAGNSELHDAMQERLGGSNAVLLMSENLRPTLRDERLRQSGRLLDHQFRSRCLPRVPGLATLAAWAPGDVVPTVEALGRVVQYLALSQDKQVLAVDVGAASAALAVAFRDRVMQTLVRTDLGIVQGVEGLLEAAGIDRLVTWVPGAESPQHLANMYLNLSLQPAQYPMGEGAQRLLQGAAREAIHLLMEEATDGWDVDGSPRRTPPFDIILGTGSALREAPRPAQALSILLDGIQPTGITHLLRDRLGMAAAIGALADVTPHAAADLIDAQGFESLGIVISVTGKAQSGDEVLRFRLTQGDGITEGVVEQGQSYRFPTTVETTLELRPARHMDIGLGPGVGTSFTRVGDTVGFVIDARGRPLSLPADLPARRAHAEEWLKYVGA